MLTLPASVRIDVAAEAVDLRRGFDGLAAAVMALILDIWSGYADSLSERTQDQLDGWSPAITEGQGTQLDDVLAAVLLPAGAAALEAQPKEALTGRLDVPAPERQPEPASPRVVHSVCGLAVALQVGDRRMDGMVVAGAFIDRKSTRLNSSHSQQSRMPSSA